LTSVIKVWFALMGVAWGTTEAGLGVDVAVREGVGAGAGLGTGELGVGAAGAVCSAAVADGEADGVEVWLDDEVEAAAGDGFDGGLGEIGGLEEGLAGELVEDGGVAAAAVTPLPRAISAAPKTAPRSLPRPVMRATL
jgi:hypothetical protein